MNTKYFGQRMPVLSRAVLLAAAAAAAVTSLSAQAAIVDSGPVNITIPANIDGVYFNVVTAATGTAGASVAGWDVNLYQTGAGLTFFWPSTPANSSGGVVAGTVYAPQPVGASIGPTSTFALTSGGGGDPPFANFRVTGDHNLGIRFFNEATGAINFGYVTIRATAPSGFPASIIRYVYENNGTAITVTAPGGAAVAPTLAFNPATGSTVTFTGGTAVGSTRNGSIAVALGTPAGAGTGAPATTTLTCTPPTAPFSGFGQTITAVGNGAVSGTTLSGTCTVAAAAATQTLTCNENRGGTANTRTWTLSCPAAAAAPSVASVPVFHGNGLWLMLLLVFGFGMTALIVRRN
jgi:hypothetical protein